MRYRDLITEIKHYKTNELQDGDVVVILGNGEVFTGDSTEDIVRQYFAELERYFRKDNTSITEEDIVDMLHMHEEELYGEYKVIKSVIDSNSLHFDGMSELSPSSQLNKALQKVVDYLGLDGITYESEDFETGEGLEHYIRRNELLGSTISNTRMYHGTTSEFLDTLKTYGIKPTNSTNYKKIKHNNLIFFTSKQLKARAHAINAVENHGGIPIILEFNVPDPTKVVLDYDVALSLYGLDHPKVRELGYDVVFALSGAKKEYLPEPIVKIDGLSKLDLRSVNTKTGIFGYNGRVPAKFISKIHTDAEAIVLYNYSGEVIIEPTMTKYGGFEELYDAMEHYKIMHNLDNDEDY